ncbi:antitoxin family protein [Pyrodictium abyssi]|uniref:Antitoxin n=1 Tax=Pyrodictium abyssi TaxID=54256 RepID=A0ABM8IZC4_9CREN|nr:hypothetical protein PABY_24550 [Pyrodictium abyssi]
MSRVIRARYEKGVLKPLEKLDLREGEEIEIIIRRAPSHVFGVLLRRKPDLKPEDIDKVIEEIENEGVLLTLTSFSSILPVVWKLRNS